MKNNRSKNNKKYRKEQSQAKENKILSRWIILAAVVFAGIAAISIILNNSLWKSNRLTNISTESGRVNAETVKNENAGIQTTLNINNTNIAIVPTILANTVTNQGGLRKIQIKTPEDKASLFFHQADQLFNNGLVKEAITLYQKALELSPDDEEIHYNIAIAYAIAKDTNMAIRHYQEAIKLVPEFVEVHNNLGNLYMRLGKYDEAREHFLFGLKVMPEDAQIRNSYGTLLGLQGKHKEALEEFRAAVKYDPDYPEAQFNLAMGLVKARQYDEAITQLKQLGEKHPDMDFVNEWIEKIRKIKEQKNDSSISVSNNIK